MGLKNNHWEKIASKGRNNPEKSVVLPKQLKWGGGVI